MTLQDRSSRFHLPTSIRLLTSPGIRGHSLIFSGMLTLLAGIAYVGRFLGAGQAWTAIFTIGATTAASYLVLSLLALPERTRGIILHSGMQTRVILMAIIAGPLLAGLYYWISQAGSVEALPIFPVFIVIFYGWTLLQSYFIAAPASQLFKRAETRIIGGGKTKSAVRTIGISTLFLPIVPLLYGVWSISNWLNSTYQNVQGASGKILAWTLVVAVLMVLTYCVCVSWGWKTIKENRPESAIFVGGIFVTLWAYLLYRATSLITGYVTLNQSVNPLLDGSLVVVSIIGAMQTFAKKTMRSSNARWSQVLPFLVFAFGTVFAVTQYYFILQYVVTRVELSIGVNAAVFATGLVLLLYLTRRHLQSTNLSTNIPIDAVEQGQSSSHADGPGRRLPSLLFRRKKKSVAEQVQELVGEGPDPMVAEADSQPGHETTVTQEPSTAEFPDDKLADSEKVPDDDT